MKIEIVGAESLGVRGLCCLVSFDNRRVFIDPGVALGHIRHGLMPHPFQVALGARIRERIIRETNLATDVVFSHFHGDHVPLADANPYQLPLSADYMEVKRRFLEASRKELYMDMPVPRGWHEEYAEGGENAGRLLQGFGGGLRKTGTGQNRG
jgi:predicted metallo-beta-lactamase superfamily hydrolase